MERIKLSRSERIALWAINADTHNETFIKEFAGAISTLHDKNLISAAFSEGHIPIGARITVQGRMYLEDNPKLGNGVNWTVVGAIASILAALVGALALFLACK